MFAVIPESFLVISLFRLLFEDVSFELEVDLQLVNHLVHLERLVFVGVLRDVGGRLGVTKRQGFCDFFVQFFRRELKDVEGHVLVIHVHIVFL